MVTSYIKGTAVAYIYAYTPRTRVRYIYVYSPLYFVPVFCTTRFAVKNREIR